MSKFVVQVYNEGSDKPSHTTKPHGNLESAMAEAKQKGAGMVASGNDSKKATMKKGANPPKPAFDKGVQKPFAPGPDAAGVSSQGYTVRGGMATVSPEGNQGQKFRQPQGGSKYDRGLAKEKAKKTLQDLKALPKPNLTKDDPDEETEDQNLGGDEAGTEEFRPDTSAKTKLAAPEAGEEDADTQSGEANIDTADGDADPEIRDEETGDGELGGDDGLPTDQDPNQETGEQSVPSEEQEPGEGEAQVPGDDGNIGDQEPQDDEMPTDGEVAPAKDGEVPSDDQLPDVDGQEQQGAGGMCYIAGDGDSIGQQVGQSVLADDVEALHQVSQKINEGQNMVMDWAEQNGGRVISAGGDEFVLEMPQGCDPRALEELRQNYQQIVGATLTLGAGNSMSEAGKALIAGKLRGKDQVVQFDPSIEDELFSTHQDAGHDPDSEADKQDEHYLGSMYGQGQPDPTQQTDEHGMSPAPHEADDDAGFFHGADDGQMSGQGSAVDTNAGEIDPDNKIDPDQAIDAVTQGAEQVGSGKPESEMDEAEGDDGGDPDMADVFNDQVDRASGNNLKSKLGEILQAYRDDQSFLENAQQQNPELYREAMSLLQQMIKVARMLKPQGQPQGQQTEQPSPPPEDGKPAPQAAAAAGIGSNQGPK
jgi:hypothetical protein